MERQRQNLLLQGIKTIRTRPTVTIGNRERSVATTLLIQKMTTFDSILQGDKYWRYDSRAEVPVSSRYPQEISVVWEGIPSNIHAAFQWQNGYTYFFKDQSYYRFNDKDFTVSSLAAQLKLGQKSFEFNKNLE